MFGEWRRLPLGAKRLITYYSISVIPLVGDIFFSIYLLFRGWEIVEIGLLFSVSVFVEIFGSLAIGYFFDKGFQPKYAMFLIDFSYGIAHMVYSLFDEPSIIFLTYSLTGFLVPLSVAYQTLEKELYPEELYKEAFSIHMAFPNATQLLAMVLFGYYLTYICPGENGFKTFYRITSILYIISSIYILLFVPKSKEHAYVTKFSLKGIRGRVLPLIFAELIIIFGYQIAPQFIYFYYVYKLVGLNIFLISLTLILANIAGVLGSIIANMGKINKYSINFAIALSAISYGSFYIANFLKNDFQIFLLSCLNIFLSYLAHTIWFIYHRSLLYEGVSKAHKGKIFGILNSGRHLIYVVAPIIASAIASATTPLVNYVLSSIIILSSIPIYLNIFGSQTSKKISSRE